MTGRWRIWLAWSVHPTRRNWAVTRNDRTTGTRFFPSWREAYDYAHTHPSNRKETTP